MTGGIVFDLDGTLLNTLAGHAGSFNRALTELGFSGHDVDRFRYFIGDGAKKCAQRCLPDELHDSRVVDECVALFQADYARTWQEGTTPYPGIDALLQSLSDMAVPLAVLSNKDDVFTQEMIAKSFPGVNFGCVAGFMHLQRVRHKPDPSGPMLIAEQFGKATTDLVMVGDTATDIETAIVCGMTPIGVLWGFRDEQELLGAGALHILNAPDELISLIHKAL